MRKKPFSQTSLNCHHRITPARAGKTVCPPVEGTTAEDHPRSCGKDYMPNRKGWPDLGSPPLVRERLAKVLLILARNGITPARAGKTAAVAKSGKYSEDHPRSCGKVVLAYK